MNTPTFEELLNTGIQPEPCVLVPEPTTLEVTEEQAVKFPDEQNPYKHPAVYRRMLREQTMARVKVRLTLCQVPATELEA